MSNSSDLWKQGIYLSKTDFIIGGNIYEYDLSKANISILLDIGIISETQYQQYYSMPKLQREIAIGCLQKDKTTSAALNSGFVEMRRRFFNLNNIMDQDVLSIKKDAIYLINRIASNTQVDTHCNFRIANEYTSFYHIFKKEFYYYYNRITSEEKFDIKGIDDEIFMQYHSKYFGDFLSVLFYAAQVEGIPSAIDMLKTFYQQYIGLQLDIEYYRRFDALSRFDIKSAIGNPEYETFQADYIGNIQKEDIDISYNEKILRQLMQIYSFVYFSQRKF